MILQNINSRNFDSNFEEFLLLDKKKEVLIGRYDMEPISLEEKSSFIVNLLMSYKSIQSITLKILFWENNNIIENFINKNFINKEFKIATKYNGEEIPGTIFIDETKIDEPFLKLILDNHFNYEMALDPSLNIRLQVCLNGNNDVKLFDIYDDRGFNVYHFIKREN